MFLELSFLHSGCAPAEPNFFADDYGWNTERELLNLEAGFHIEKMLLFFGNSDSQTWSI